MLALEELVYEGYVPGQSRHGGRVMGSLWKTPRVRVMYLARVGMVAGLCACSGRACV